MCQNQNEKEVNPLPPRGFVLQHRSLSPGLAEHVAPESTMPLPGAIPRGTIVVLGVVTVSVASRAWSAGPLCWV